MISHLFVCWLLVITTVSNIIKDDDEKRVNQYIPFFVMQPHTVINQTLHSYCKEQVDFNIQPMYINLTQWPLGFIYARNPQQKFDDYDPTTLSIQECTTELQASVGDRIRIVFHPIGSLENDYDLDYFLTIPKAPCLKIRDNYETTTFDCPMLLEKSKTTSTNRQSDDYLSNSNIIYLEMLQPHRFVNDYDDSYHQFKLFFTTFTPKVRVSHNNDSSSLCPSKHLFDCDDSYCVHGNARCNGVHECRSKLDEESCEDKTSNAQSRIYSFSYFIIIMKCLFISMKLSTI